MHIPIRWLSSGGSLIEGPEVQERVEGESLLIHTVVERAVGHIYGPDEARYERAAVSWPAGRGGLYIYRPNEGHDEPPLYSSRHGEQAFLRFLQSGLSSITFPVPGNLPQLLGVLVALCDPVGGGFSRRPASSYQEFYFTLGSRLVPERTSQKPAGRGLWELVEELYLSGILVVGHPLLTVRDQFVLGDLVSLFESQEGFDGLAPVLVRHADGGLLDLRV